MWGTPVTEEDKLDLRGHARNPEMAPARLDTAGAAAIGVLAIQIMLGAFTAGLDAGFAFASWPLMGDRLFPEGGWNLHLDAIGNLRDNRVAKVLAGSQRAVPLRYYAGSQAGLN